MKLTKLIQDYIDNGANTILKEASIKTLYSKLSPINKYFIEKFGKATHKELTVENIREYQRWRDPQVGNVQKEKEARVLKILIKRAVANGLIRKDFSDQIYKYKPTQTQKSKTIIEPERLVEAINEVEQKVDKVKFAAFYLGHSLMLRPAELLNLRYENIIWNLKKIRVEGTKTETSDDTLPLSDKAVEVIKGIKEKDEGRVFDFSYSHLIDIYQEIHQKCEKVPEDITPHKARKNMASFLMYKGVNIKTIQELGRWKNPNVLLKIYAKSSNGQMLKAVNEI